MLLQPEVQVGTLDVVDEVALHSLVLVEVEHADCLCAIRLNQIVTVAVLIGLVDIAHPFRRLNRIEQIAAKGEDGVVYMQC